MKNWVIYIIAALGFVVYGCSSADRDGGGAIVDGGTLDAFQVQVGDCFDDTDSYDDEVTSLPAVPCSDPHDNEAYAVFDVKVASYPGDDAMWELASDACLERFEPFVGKDYESSALDFFPIYPSSESWRENDREVICSLYDMDTQKLVGSVKGQGL